MERATRGFGNAAHPRGFKPQSNGKEGNGYMGRNVTLSLGALILILIIVAIIF